MQTTRTITAADLVSQAKAQVENLTADQVAVELQSPDVVLIDLREPEERSQNGTLPGAVHAARGMLEFYADPTSPYHRPEFDPNRRTILHCASGGRSALAAQVLQVMGYTRVAHLDGGLKGWIASGREVCRD